MGFYSTYVSTILKPHPAGHLGFFWDKAGGFSQLTKDPDKETSSRVRSVRKKKNEQRLVAQRGSSRWPLKRWFKRYQPTYGAILGVICINIFI